MTIDLRAPRSRRSLPLLLAALAAGCVIPLEVGDGRGDEGDEQGSQSTSNGSETGDPSTGATSGPGSCDASPDFQCAGPIDCTDGGCGGPFDPFDASGCLRPTCGGPEDCGAGETCFTPLDFGGCASSGLSCSDQDGTCQCGGDADCGGSYCVPDDEVPSAQCFGQPDEGACLAAGCSHFEVVTQITETCDCVPAQPACLWFLDGIGGGDSPDYFWHEDTGTVALFSTSWAEAPVGWRRCSEPGAPAACGCYEPFMDPVCP